MNDLKNFFDKYYEKLLNNVKPKLYAKETIKKLREDGNEIYIITARFLTDRNDELGNRMRKIVLEWLKENNIFYDNIIFSPEDKINICIENDIDLMIEDKVENINIISQKIPVICFDAKYNQQCKGKNIIRCYSWYDIYAKIQELIRGEK